MDSPFFVAIEQSGAHHVRRGRQRIEIASTMIISARPSSVATLLRSSASVVREEGALHRAGARSEEHVSARSRLLDAPRDARPESSGSPACSGTGSG